MMPRARHPILIATLPVALALALGGCSTISSVNKAARNLDAYELNPLPIAAVATRPSSRILFVAEPTVSGATGSERIVVKPDALQVTFLGDGRWVETAPVHIRNLLARSFANSGRLTMSTTSSIGPLPDYTLLTDVDHFQAEILPRGSAAPAQVVVGMTLTLVRDADSSLIATRRFYRVVAAADTDAPAIAAAFDAAMTPLLRDATSWGLSVMTGRGLGV